MRLKVALPHDFNQSPNRSVLSQVDLRKAENEFFEGGTALSFPFADHYLPLGKT